MSLLLDVATAKQLKCVTCGCYLSVDPITQCQNGYCCGRCQTDEKNAIVIFEILAKTFKFPCSYDVHGCEAAAFFGEKMREHENTCQYRSSSCPVTLSCDWRGYAKDVLSHCSEKHAKNVMKSPDLEVDLTKVVEFRVLGEFHRGQVLLLTTNYQPKSGLIVELSPLLAQGLPSKYKLHLSSLDRTKKAELHDNEIVLPAKPLHVRLDVLKSLDERKILLELSVENNISHSLCTACGSNISLHFYTCNRSHYFCAKCYNTGNCTACETPLKRRSNYQKMKDDVPYGCCNALYECSFSGTSKKLEEHENNCFAGECFVKGCSWNGVRFAFRKHIEEKHHNILKDRELLLHHNAVMNFIRLNDYIFVVASKMIEDLDVLQVTVNVITSFPGDFSKWKALITLQGTALSFTSEVVPIKDSCVIDYSSSLSICATLVKKHEKYKIVVFNTL